MVSLRPHQQKALDELDNGKILCGGVGTGKSRVAAAYYVKVETDADVYVITTARKRDSLDWEGEFAQFGIGRHLDGTLGGTLVVDSWNNIGKYRDIKGAFFIFDEQRIVGSGEWAKNFLAISKANRWILLTATPGDTWLDYIPVFVANGFYKNRTEFKYRHVVYNTYSKFPKVERYTQVGQLVRHRNNLLVEMPYERHTTRITEVLETDYDHELFEKVLRKRWHVYENRPLRDVAELFSVMRKVVNSDRSRLETLRTLLVTHPRVIVFYNFDYELEILRQVGGNLKNFSEEILPLASLPRPVFEGNGRTNTELLEKNSRMSSDQSTTTNGSGSRNSAFDTPSLVVAEWNGHKHEPVPTSQRWVYLVQYAAGAEAWNCITTDAMVFYSLTYSYKMWEQSKGRIDRLDTPFINLFYYVLKSKSVIDTMVWKSVKNKQNFNESKSLANLTEKWL